MTARAAAVLLVVPLALSASVEAHQRVVFADRTFLDVDDAWADDRYVHFIYHGRLITVLRPDVTRIEGTRPSVAPSSASACPPPHAGQDDQAVRAHFRCLGVRWTRAPTVENGQRVWIYEGRVADRVEHYRVKDGRLLDITSSPAP